MIDPQKLIATSISVFIVFLTITFLIRKKKKFGLYFVILASLLPLISLLRKGVHQSGDFAINISKAYDLWNSLSYGIFPVHWASILNATYGYPLFLFTYPLPYYAIALPKFLGISFIASEKFWIAVVFILSGIGTYLLLKQFLNKNSSSLGAILYLFAPYHLVDMHFRIALGELFAFAFLPFVFYSIFKIKTNASRRYITLLFVAYFCLMLSHQAATLIATPFIIITPLFLNISKKKLLHIYIALFCAFLASSFYWLPVLEGTAHTLQVEFAKSISFEDPKLYFISPWRFGFLYQGPVGQLSFPMGFVQIILTVFLTVSLMKDKVNKRLKKISFILLLILWFFVFLLFPFSDFLWKKLPLMTNFQFSYRMMLPISFILAIIGAISVDKIKNSKVVYSIAIVAILITILNWGTRAMLTDITDSYLMHHTPYTTFEGEGLQPAAPINRNPNNIWEKTPPKSSLEVEKGRATVSIISKTPTKHTYLVNASQKTDFIENTYYFPGWNLYINGKRHAFTYIDLEKTNRMHFKLPPGVYEVQFLFEETPIVRFANTVSVLGVILIAIYLVIPQRRK